MIDMHCHILPGVDDGVKTPEEAEQSLLLFKKNGIDKIIFTPHMNHPSVKTKYEEIIKSFEKIKPLAEKTGIDVFLGSELYLTPDYSKYIPILDRFVMIELPTAIYPIYFLDTLFNIELDGYEIILAHAERYKWLYENRSLQKKLKDMNVYFQINTEGTDTAEGKYYIENDYVEFISSDFHGFNKRKEIDFSKYITYENIQKKMSKILGI